MNEKKTIPPRYIYTYNRYVEVARLAKQNETRHFRLSQTDFVNEIVISVANGLDIKNVDPQLYPIIINPLEAKREEFLFGALKNITAAKLISSAIDQIHKYFSRKEKERKKREEMEKTKINNESQKCNSKIYSKKYINKAVSIILEYEETKNDKILNKIDPEIYSLLIDELRALTDEALLRKDFKMADKYKNSMQTVILLRSEDKYSQITNSHATELQQKFESAIKDYKSLRLSWQQKIDSMNQKIDNQIKQIQNETEEMLIEFDKQFIPISNTSKNNHNSNPSTQSDSKISDNPSKTTPQISQTNSNFELDRNEFVSSRFKPSPKLLELRKCEQSLAISKRYIEARKLKHENDKIEAIERNQFIERYNNELENKRKELIKRQQDTIDITFQKGQQKLNTIRKQMDEQLKQAELSLRHLEDSVNEANKLASLSYLPKQNSKDLTEIPSQSLFSNNKDDTDNNDNSKNKDNQKINNFNDNPKERHVVIITNDNNINANNDKLIDLNAQDSKTPRRNLSVSKCKSLPHLDQGQNQNHSEVKIKRYYSLDIHPLPSHEIAQMKPKREALTRRTSYNRSRYMAARPINTPREQNLFFKRRMINSIIYSKSSKQQI